MKSKRMQQRWQAQHGPDLFPPPAPHQHKNGKRPRGESGAHVTKRTRMHTRPAPRAQHTLVRKEKSSGGSWSGGMPSSCPSFRTAARVAPEMAASPSLAFLSPLGVVRSVPISTSFQRGWLRGDRRPGGRGVCIRDKRAVSCFGLVVAVPRVELSGAAFGRCCDRETEDG